MDSLEEIVYPAADIMNGVLPAGEELKKEQGAVCFGVDAVLDSINLLNFIGIVEEQFRKVAGHNISLVNPAVIAMDRKSTRLNSSHLGISYAVFCLKKKNIMKLKKHITPTSSPQHRHAGCQLAPAGRRDD